LARTARNASLDTRTARLRLKARKKPYFTPSGKKGISLGYRRSAKGNGSWIAKRYVARTETGGQYETEVFAEADDYADADGAAVLDYFQAMAKLGTELSEIQKRTRYTVNDAVKDYVEYLKRDRKSTDSGRDAEIRLNAYLIPYFDGQLLSDLTSGDFDKWVTWALEHRPKGRKKKAPQKESKAKAKAKLDIPPSELRRRRRANLTRTINSVKACFNRALETGNVSSGEAWRRLRKFKNVDASRTRWLTIDESKRLMNACDGGFRKVVQAALLTGCRWGELREMRVRDYDDDSGTVLVAESKSGKARRVPLTEEGQNVFEEWTVGRGDNEFLFTKQRVVDDKVIEEQWGTHDQHRPMKAACGVAKIDPPIGIHALRHTYASSLVQAKVSLAVVAEALGHSDTRMVSKHYGHLAPSHVADAIRANLPELGIVVEGKVKRIRA